MACLALACTGDPLLDLMLTECSSISLLPACCETVAEALHEIEAAQPTFLFTSPALGEIGPLLGRKGIRICWLWEGPGLQAPEGVETLSAERLTPQLVDGWVRRPRRDGGPTRSRAIPPPPPLPTIDTPRERVAPQPRDRGAPPADLRSPSQKVAAPSRAEPPAPRDLPAPRSQTPRPQPPRRPPARTQPPPPRPLLSVLRQQVVALWGGKPGAGRSTLAVALSDLLARAGEIRVCTVDLNPYNSSLAALLGKEQEAPSWLHLGEAISGGLPFPSEALRWVRPNWALLSGPDGHPDWVEQLGRESIAWLVEGLRSQFDYIILDPDVRPGPISETAARLAQVVLVTVSADYPDVLDTARAFEAGLEQGWLDRSRCRLVLSRWLESPHLSSAEVADCFSLPVSLTLPVSAEAVVQASGQGIPVTQVESQAAGPLQQALGRLVGIVAPTVAATNPGRAVLGGSLLGWFGR